MKIKSTLEKEHNISTINEGVGGFNSIGQTNGNWYISVGPGVYDYNDYSSAIGEYSISDGNYCVFMNLTRESADDSLYMYITRYRISDGFLDINRFYAGGYTTSVTSVKYYNSHIYITHVDEGSYWYEDYDIINGTNTTNNGQYAGSGVDVGNTGIELDGYKMSSKLNTESIGSDRYHKNHIRMEKII